MDNVSFRFIERTQGFEAAQAAERDALRSADAYTQYFDDEVFTGGLYGEACPSEPDYVAPETFDQRVYRFGGRVSVVAVINGIPTIEHRSYWSTPELPADERTYIRAYYWGGKSVIEYKTD